MSHEYINRSLPDFPHISSYIVFLFFIDSGHGDLQTTGVSCGTAAGDGWCMRDGWDVLPGPAAQLPAYLLLLGLSSLSISLLMSSP